MGVLKSGFIKKDSRFSKIKWWIEWLNQATKNELLIIKALKKESTINDLRFENIVQKQTKRAAKPKLKSANS